MDFVFLIVIGKLMWKSTRPLLHNKSDIWSIKVIFIELN